MRKRSVAGVNPFFLEKKKTKKEKKKEKKKEEEEEDNAGNECDMFVLKQAMMNIQMHDQQKKYKPRAENLMPRYDFINLKKTPCNTKCLLAHRTPLKPKMKSHEQKENHRVDIKWKLQAAKKS